MKLALYKSMEYGRYQLSVIIRVSEKSSNIGAETNNGTEYPRLWHQNLMQVLFISSKELNIYCNQRDSLQETLENIINFVLINVYV